jgi:uncharacterized protein (TIGR02270 family)
VTKKYAYRENWTQPMLDFSSEIYREHLEEISFLYEQRLSLLDNPEVGWPALQDFERRLTAHIDALVDGEDLALSLCRIQATEGDAGELHAAVRLFCRQNRIDLLREVLQRLDPEQEENVRAVIDAVKYELPAGWNHEIIQMLSGKDRSLVLFAAEVAGYRRLPARTGLLQVLERKDSATVPVLIWALGRLRERDSGALISDRFLDSETSGPPAALALLRMGVQGTANRCLRLSSTADWPAIPLGLGGGRPSVSVLLKRASNPSAGIITALGLLGDISAVDILLRSLCIKDLAESAAEALNLITGAGIFEEVFIPEEIGEDELLEEELEEYKKGKIPTREDGTAFGVHVRRLSQKQEDWSGWWTKNKSRFSSDVRYRNGKPYSPAGLLENLQSERNPRQVRQLAYEEFVIRYGAEIPFESDMPVEKQKQAIAWYTDWVNKNGNRFLEGKWYFSGQEIE